MSSTRPAIPEAFKRILRQEAYFGCVLCGSPIIEYHHIIPFHKVKKHEKNNLVILCPEHHHRANCVEIFEEIVINAKKNPFNKKNNIAKKDFFLGKFNDIIVDAGGNRFINVKNIFVVDDTSLLKLEADCDGWGVITANFYNEHNKLIAQIIRNEWITYDIKELWDVRYSPGQLRINEKRGKIFLELRVKHNTVEIRTDMYFKGKCFSLKPNETILNGGVNMIKNITFQGDNRDDQCGLRMSSVKGEFGFSIFDYLKSKAFK